MPVAVLLRRLCASTSPAALVVLLASGCAAQEPPRSVGPTPQIPPAESRLVPTLKWSVADGWEADAKPTPAPGLVVGAFARGLKHPRWLLVLPNGDVLAAEAASEPSASWSPRAIAQTLVQRRSGAIVESANRISLLRDVNRDGVADERTTLLDGLRQPFGMALIGDHLYIANTDSVVRYPFTVGQTSIGSPGTKLLDLPVGHHWTRNLLPSRDGTKLFVTVGSGSNIGENGLAKEEGRAAILELDLASGRSRIFASGLRNPNGMAIEPTTGALWTVVNERDEIGDETPPDYLTSVQDGGFYGWPYSYWGKTVDARVEPQRPELVERSLTPDYALGGHVAALGLAYSESEALPAPFRRGMFVGLHGSWNRSEYSGYRVIFVPFRDGRPDGLPIDVLTGFIDADGGGRAYGRPVGVALDGTGALLVADDTGNTIWRVIGR